MGNENYLYHTLRDNSEHIARQRKLPIKIIVGNPPYSAGQKSANDNAQNAKYPALDARIEATYASRTNTTNKNSLYDSYIRAFRWASDRLQKGQEGGVIGFIINSKWLDSNAAAGFRLCLEKEFSSIYIFDMHGAIRGKSGELARKEGGNIFNIMTGVCLVLLIHNPESKEKTTIRYSNIGDYLKREEKLKKLVEHRSIASSSMNWEVLEPNEHGDWLNQRSDLFGSYIILGDKKDKKNKSTVFEDYYSNGLKTQRDVWCYNFSKKYLSNNIKNTISFYNDQCNIVAQGGNINYDATKFSWSDNPKTNVHKGKTFTFNECSISYAQYRPFCKSHVYFSRELNERVYQIPQLFPTPAHKNIVITVAGTGGRKDFSALISNQIPDLEIIEKSQCFPLYYYKQKDRQQLSLFTSDADAFEKKDGITDWILKNIRARFGNTRAITKEHIFYYVYGILHSKDYRTRFNADLKKSLPRIPIVDTIEDFMTFSMKGKELAELHLNYEEVPPYDDLVVTGAEKGNFTVDKMRFPKNGKESDKTTIIYNGNITITNIPLKAYEYVVNGRSAIDWIIERYQVKTDKDSGIVNNPNHWAEEHGKPRYILDLLCSVVNVSMQTVAIVDSLPELKFEE